jgi:hypothetical protein
MSSSARPSSEPAPESWETVLAAVEADLHRTERLLGPSVVSCTPGLAPAELMLPADGPVLPPLELMPPVPADLIGHIKELQVRIGELQADLERCLAAARRPDHSPARPLLAAPTVEHAHFVDRRA